MKLDRFRKVTLSALAVAALALAAAVPAEATFPGKAGPIAYSAAGGTGLEVTGGIFLHGPRLGQQPQQVTTDGQDSSPAFSANGKLIAFVGYRETVASGQYPKPHIYVMNADGSGARQLTSGDSFDYDPAFSPDGREVVFDRKVGSSNSPHIYSVELNSSTVQQLTRGSAHDTEPVFAPDGSRIVFVSNRDVDGRRDHSDIFEMAPDGTRIRILIDGRRDEYEPDVAPNSRRIVFMSNRDGGPDIYTAHKDGHGVRRVTSDRPNCFDSSCWSSPVYSPDGSHIAALRSSRYSTSLEVMRVDGGGVKEFASGSTEEEGYGTVIGPPSWGPAPK